ncbi:MAG: hypothetical protein ACYDHZ_00975 [Dehalococcoidia bacterium]
MVSRVTGKQLLALLENQLEDHYGKVDHPVKGWGKLRQVGMCYGPRDGCLNEGSSLYNDDTLDGIITLFRAYTAVIRDKVEDFLKINMPDWLHIVIEPSWEDTTEVVVIFERQLSLPRVVWELNEKAWNFQWETPKEMGKDMLAAYRTMVNRLGGHGTWATVFSAFW